VKTRCTLSLALLALAAWSGRARAEDDWLGRDKALHAGVSAGLAAGGYAVSSIWFDGRVERAAAGAGLALTAGAAKEVWDSLGDGDASWKDAAWDVIGTAVGVGVALLVDQLATR
jgi:putative lipoprotein